MKNRGGNWHPSRTSGRQKLIRGFESNRLKEELDGKRAGRKGIREEDRVPVSDGKGVSKGVRLDWGRVGK